MELCSMLFKRKSHFPLLLPVIRKYAKKARPPQLPSLGKKAIKIELEEARVLGVEDDPNQLLNYVCGTNILKTGGENIKIKPDCEYPDWLWELKIGTKYTLEDMDPNTLEYWEEVQRLGKIRHEKLFGKGLL